MVALAEPDASWPAAYADEAARLRAALGPVVREVHHIGSTAVPLLAKPIIDVLVVAPDLEAIDARREALEKAGYKWRGENGIAGRRYLKRRKNGHRAHVHAFPGTHPAVPDHLFFRDALRASTALADGYAELKRVLRVRHDGDREAYTDGKDEFITAALAGEPQFGVAEPELEYRPRASAYVLAHDERGRLLGVRAKGVFHLPGGGLDGSEDATAAALRELHEETGYVGDIVAEVGRASQYVIAARKGPLNKHATFFHVRLRKRTGDGVHEVAWLDDGPGTLHWPFQRWAAEHR